MPYITSNGAVFRTETYDANDLIAALDGSMDCKNMERFDEFLVRKYNECSDLFITDVLMMGVERPVCVLIELGMWLMGDGHHRLAVASRHHLSLDVLFDTDGNYMHHGVCSDREMTRLSFEANVGEYYGNIGISSRVAN